MMLHWLEQRREELLRFAGDLVATPSPNLPGDERAVVVVILAEMERLGIILDATHLCDESFWEALDHYHGPVWASHQNCRALVPACRQFTDEQLQELIRRDAVIGGVFDAWMMSTSSRTRRGTLAIARLGSFMISVQR